LAILTEIQQKRYATEYDKIFYKNDKIFKKHQPHLSRHQRIEDKLCQVSYFEVTIHTLKLQDIQEPKKTKQQHTYEAADQSSYHICVQDC